jgi:PilZ domain
MHTRGRLSPHLNEKSLNSPRESRRSRYREAPLPARGVMYEQSALVLDAGDQYLGRLSLVLIGLGHRPLYASDLDELVLLARERKQHVRSVVLPAARALEIWSDVNQRIVAPLGLAPSCVLLLGEKLDDSASEALHEHGVRWALWQPFSVADLRFALSHALWAADPDDVRLDSRVPCSIPVEVHTEDAIVPACLTDISMAGSFVQVDQPLPEGSSIAVRGNIRGRLVSLQCRVAWCTDAQIPSWRRPGMGVEFEQVGGSTLELLRRLVDDALDRFRLARPAS